MNSKLLFLILLIPFVLKFNIHSKVTPYTPPLTGLMLLYVHSCVSLSYVFLQNVLFCDLIQVGSSYSLQLKFPPPQFQVRRFWSFAKNGLELVTTHSNMPVMFDHHYIFRLLSLYLRFLCRS